MKPNAVGSKETHHLSIECTETHVLSEVRVDIQFPFCGLSGISPKTGENVMVCLRGSLDVAKIQIPHSRKLLVQCQIFSPGS